MGRISAELDRVYVPIEGEDDSWCQTMGLKIAESVYKLLTVEGYDPSSEKWQFRPGALVKCERRTIEGDEVLAAVSEAELG